MSLIAFVGVSLIWTGLIAGCAELLTRTHAEPRYARIVWRIAAGLMVLPWLTAGAGYLWPSAVADLPVPDIPDLAFAGAVGGPSDAFDAANQFPVAISTVVLIVLAVGWALRLLCGLRAQVRLQRLKSTALGVDDPQMKTIANTFAHDLRLTRTPDVCVISGLASPFAAGIQARRIYLPQHVLGGGHEPMIIAHESLHIATGDLIMRPFERLVADVLWFSPFAWIARRRLDYLREAVCDEATIQLTGQRKAYARALVDVARAETVQMPLPVASLILNDRGSLKRRVASLMQEDRPKPTRIGVVALLSLVLALPLAVAQGVKAAGPSDVFTHPIVAKGKIVSPYGERIDPYTKKSGWHGGIDIAGELKQPIMSPTDGVVVYADMKKGYGKSVWMQLPDGRRISFSHLYKIKVKEGDSVEAGQVIGLMGKAGPDQKPHVHFEIRKAHTDAETGELIYKQYDPERFDIDLIRS